MKFYSSTGVIRLTTRGVKKKIHNIKTFYNEYESLQKLENVDGVINLLDADTNKGILYLEHHPQDLHNYIITNNKIIGLAKTRPAYINETMKIFNKLLIPLNECHQNNIVHGDIKPENILISREQEPILIDFGQSVDMSIPDSKYVTMGTEGFMPPELNKNIYGPFTDIYSLGITLYISLLCKKPFILECGNIDFDFNDNQEDLPYKITNMIVDMTDPYYENRPTVGMLLEDYSLDEYDLK